ncbi:MAG: hypothetical protein GQ535_03760 [Rhodobacteraceae bacterium]|nr:hypothetical protein [Paracoccaceae bacterium]
MTKLQTSKLMLSLDFNFYGARTRVVCQMPCDMDHLRYYYGDHQAAESKPHLTIYLQTDPECSFFDHMRNENVEKRISVDTGKGPVLYEAFHLGAKRPTPLPPIGFTGIGPDLFLYHGAALLLPDRGAVLIRGDSGVGKTMLLLSLFAQTQSHFVSDDMLVMDPAGQIWPIFRPVGIRRVILDQIAPKQRDAALQAKAIDTASGTTYMVRPARLAPLAKMHGHSVVLDIKLAKSSEFQCRSTTFSHHERLDISYDPQVHLQTATNMVLARVSPFARAAQ